MRVPGRKGHWFAAAAAATLAIVWLWPAGRSDGPVPLAPAVPALATSPTAPGLSLATAVQVAPGVEVAGDVPPGISREQWAALQAELRGRPDGPAELHRLADYFAWSDALRRFREARSAGTAAADLRLLAQALDDGLSERLRRSEVTAAEARQIESAVLEAIEPDPSLRADLLERWTAVHLAPPAAIDPRQAEFERRQSVIVAAWSAQPAEARDRNALARDLEALRRQTFAPGSP
jgi:hypothetical protein